VQELFSLYTSALAAALDAKLKAPGLEEQAKQRWVWAQPSHERVTWGIPCLGNVVLQWWLSCRTQACGQAMCHMRLAFSSVHPLFMEERQAAPQAGCASECA
jgi:hypothetical protein